MDMQGLIMLPNIHNDDVKNIWQKTYLDSFLAQGWPSSKNEDWKFTSLSQLLTDSFDIALELGGDIAEKQAPKLPGNKHKYSLIFRNGVLDSELSHAGDENVRFSNLLDDDHALSLLKNNLLENHPIFNLTLGAMQSAVLIDVSETQVEQTPLIDLSFVGGIRKQSAHPVVVIRVAEKAQVKISEFHASANGLSAPIIVVDLAKGAVCDHIRCQVADLDTSQLGLSLVNQDAESDYNNFSFSSGGDVSRAEMHLNLNGENAQCKLSAIYLGREDQHLDITTRLYHNVANCTSDQIIRGVLDDRARGVFQGKIRVAQDAQKTDGQQMTRALLLSRETEADTKPELEIFADDVVCSHGATVGEIDENQLFYLVSRGIPTAQARAMLIEAFLIDTLTHIRAPELSEQVQFHIQDWVLKSALLSANNV